VYHVESENVVTACRMMMMSMMKKKEEVLHHLSHIVGLPVYHHHQPLLQTDQGLLDTDVIAGKCMVMNMKQFTFDTFPEVTDLILAYHVYVSCKPVC
jgi:hypothetical protein